FTAIENNCQKTYPDQDEKADHEQRQNQCNAFRYSFTGKVILHDELLSVTPQGSDLPQPLRISNMVSKFELSYHCAVERLASYIRFSPTSDKGLTPAVTS